MKKIWVYTPVILVVCISFVQLYLSEQQSLTKWKGYGFGMYTEPGARELKLTLFTKNLPPISFFLYVDEFYPQTLDYKFMPNQKHLDALTHEITTSKWFYNAYTKEAYHRPATEKMKAGEKPLIIYPDSLELALYAYTINVDSATARLKPIKSLRLPWNP